MRTIRILFADDTRDTRELFRMAMKVNGMETRLAVDGEEAVAAVREELFDAIILDIEMPRMDGWRALREIRALGNGATVPIFMFTAYGDSEYRKRALASGANDLWHKPILPSEVMTRVFKHLA